MQTHDAVVVGSGINGLVAAALLARGGWDVAVLERGDRLGGAIRTERDTLAPGYTIELMSGWHPLFTGGPAYAELGDDLEPHGLEYVNTQTPTGIVTLDGTAVLSTDNAANIAEFDRLGAGDGAAWDAAFADFTGKAGVVFGLIGAELLSAQGLGVAGRAVRQLRPRGTLALGAELLEPARAWLTRTFRSPIAQALLAPWVLHNGLGPDDAGSAFVARLVAAALVNGGVPVPVGGGVRLVDALAGIVRDVGGSLVTGADVDRVLVEDGRATGVRTRDGGSYGARHAVLASVTPQALYLDLLADADVPARLRDEAAAFRYGRGDMQIHLALSEPPRWRRDHDRLSRVPVLHVSPGLDDLSRSVNEATRRLLPGTPTIAVGQPCVLDPSRAPGGGAVIWIQLQETPSRPVGDAADEIDTGDGRWTDGLRERYADRVVARLGEHVENLDSATVARQVLSPADLEALNRNLVGGDPYGGACALDQYFLWRPLPSAPGHTTFVKGLYHIGASTHPGPGLGGGSGYLVAKRLLRPAPAQRLLQTARRTGWFPRR